MRAPAGNMAQDDPTKSGVVYGRDAFATRFGHRLNFHSCIRISAHNGSGSPKIRYRSVGIIISTGLMCKIQRYGRSDFGRSDDHLTSFISRTRHVCTRHGNMTSDQTVHILSGRQNHIACRDPNGTI